MTNENDLISRADAIEALNRSSIYAWSTEQDLVAHSWAIRILQSIQSAEAVQGEWIDTGNWMGTECSRCKCHSRYVTPFCPYCGARMRVPIRPVELKKPFTVDEIPTNYEPRILGNVEAEKKK